MDGYEIQVYMTCLLRKRRLQVFSGGRDKLDAARKLKKASDGINLRNNSHTPHQLSPREDGKGASNRMDKVRGC